MHTPAPVPSRIELKARSKELVVHYPDGEFFELPAEYLRVHSPSAEVRGHGFGQERLQVGKRLVGINGVEPVGNYGLKLIFDDGHDTGIYTWQYLRDLYLNRERNWQDYLQRLAEAGASREP